jgi:CRP/FNR family transcriptional regulator, nitrogen oxide reductase regulator
MMPRPRSPVRLEWVDPAVCSLEYRLKIIGRLPFFKHLPAEATSRINNLFHDFDVSADERIYHEGDEAEYLYLVAMGKVKLIRNTESGRDVMLDILHGGDYFGSFSTFGGRVYMETAIAQTDCCILRISASDFDHILAQYPDVTRKVLEAVSQRLAESQEIVRQLSAFSAEERIASALLRLAGKLGEARGEGILIQLPFSRQDLAAMTGSTIETVSRVISRFAENGWVKTGRRWVTILNPKRLEELVHRTVVE